MNSINSMTDETIADVRVNYRTAKIDEVEIFYREAGPADAPALLLLHGFPTSSHMFRDLIPRLADKYRVIAPDYPGFGQSAMPDRSKFTYTFDNYAQVVNKLIGQLGIGRFALYVMDYGAPIGFRLASKYPERVPAIVVQNGNAYNEGIEQYWDPIKSYWRTGGSTEREAIRWLTSIKATQWQYTNGVKDLSLVSPDTWTLDQALLDRQAMPRYNSICSTTTAPTFRCIRNGRPTSASVSRRRSCSGARTMQSLSRPARRPISATCRTLKCTYWTPDT